MLCPVSRRLFLLLYLTHSSCSGTPSFGWGRFSWVPSGPPFKAPGHVIGTHHGGLWSPGQRSNDRSSVLFLYPQHLADTLCTQNGHRCGGHAYWTTLLSDFFRSHSGEGFLMAFWRSAYLSISVSTQIPTIGWGRALGTWSWFWNAPRNTSSPLIFPVVSLRGAVAEEDFRSWFKGCRRHSAIGVWQTWIKLWAFYLLLRSLWANRWVPKWNSVTKAHGKPTNFVFLLIYFIPSAINKGWQIGLLGQHTGQCRTISQEVPVS